MVRIDRPGGSGGISGGSSSGGSSGVGSGATIATYHLMRDPACNRDTIARCWTGSLPASDYRRLAARLTQAVTLPADAFARPRGVEAALARVPGLDGTGRHLRLRTAAWRIDRRLDDGPDGRAIAAVFRDLLARYGPASGWPASASPPDLSAQPEDTMP